VTDAAARRAGIAPGLAAELVAAGHDEVRILGRLLELPARSGIRNPPGWLRDKVARGPAPDVCHRAAKAMLEPALPMGWLTAQAGAAARAPGPPARAAPAEAEAVGEILRRMA